MDVSAFMNMDESPNSSKDACMVELVSSPRGDGKRQRCIGENSNDMSYADAMRQDDIKKDESHWEHLRCMENILMEDCIRENVKVVEEFVDDEVAKVEIDKKEFLGSFANFIDRGVILFFTGKIPFLWRVKQWLRGILQADCVQDVYAGPRGFYEVILISQEYKEKLLNKLPVFYEKSLVHIVPWRPLVEYQDILKQECPVWVEVECTYSVVWPILRSAMEKLGKILVPPSANAQNRYRMCILWNTAIKRPSCLQIACSGMPPMYFRLKWGTFAGHCFHCGVLGHFMAEYPQKRSNVVEVVHEEPTTHDQVQTLTISEPTKEPQIVNDKDGKTLDDEGQWSTVSGKMKKFNKNVGHNVSMEKVTPIQQTNSMRNRPWARQEDYPKKLSFDNKGNVYVPWNKRKSVPRSHEEPSGSGVSHSHSNSYAILGDLFQDMAETLAVKEKEISRIKGKNKV